MQIIETKKVRNTTLAIYSIDGRRAASFIPSGVDAAAWLSESLGLAPATRPVELTNVRTAPAPFRDGIERCQIFGDMVAHMAGDVVSVRGAVYVIDGFGQSWESCGVTLRYVYLRPSNTLTPEAAALVAELESAGLTRTEVRWSPLVAMAGVINGADVLVTIQRGTFSRDGEMVAEVFEKDGCAWGECGFYQLTDTAGVFGMINEITGSAAA